MSNTQGPAHEITQTVSPLLESKILATFGDRLRNWLMYDAPWDHAVVTIYRLKQQGHTEDNILVALRTAQRKDCRAVYGPGHPQASLF